MQADSPFRWIRKHVFGVSQDEMAAVGGVSRPRISRYEAAGEAVPFEVMRRIRAEALERGLPFSADYFFEVPAPETPSSPPDDIQ